MALTKANILSGVYQVYITDTTTTAPDVDDCTTGEVTFDASWVEIYTEGPLKLEYTGEMQGVKVNGYLSEIKKILTGESAKVSFAICEEDLRMFNFCIAASTLTAVDATTAQAGQDVLTIGDGDIVEKQLALVGKSPEGFDRVVHIPIAVCTGTFTDERTEEHAPIAVEFEVLGDPDATAGARLLTIYDLTAVAE